MSWLDIGAGAAAREAVALDALRLFVADPLTFATDPDGDCWHCGEPVEGWEVGDTSEHDEDSACPVARARAILADPSPAAARLLAVVEATRDSKRIRDGREFFVSAEAYDEAIASAVEAIWRALRALDGEA